MTSLLVSVRSSREAQIALDAGADLIDVKEPRRGALGPADPETWRAISRVVADRVPTSVALGELLFDPVEALARQCAGFRFAKIGLAGCHDSADWIGRWDRAVRALPRGVLAVPVAYADWPAARSPSPRVAVAMAHWTRARLALIDTFDKSRGGLLSHLDLDYLHELTSEARAGGITLALAGSLDETAIYSLLPLAPRYVGVRGAACAGGRDGSIDAARVKSLVALVHSAREEVAGSNA